MADVMREWEYACPKCIWIHGVDDQCPEEKKGEKDA